MAKAGGTATVAGDAPTVEGFGADERAGPAPADGADPGVRDRGGPADGGRACCPASCTSTSARRRSPPARWPTLTDADQITSTHRGHGHAVAKGATFRPMFAELFGRVDGYCHGRGGSMHINDLSIGMLGANGIVGAGLPIAVGAAFAERVPGRRQRRDDLLRRRRQQHRRLPRGGQHGRRPEAAGRLRLREQRLRRVHAAGPAHAAHRRRRPGRLLRHARRDLSTGWTPSRSGRRCQRAVDRARAGEGPTLVEAKTYRYYDHQGVKGLRLPYRTEEEVEAWKKRDAIELLEARAAADGVVEPAAFAAGLGGDPRRRRRRDRLRRRPAPSPTRRPDPQRLQRLSRDRLTDHRRRGAPHGLRELTYVKAYNEALHQVMREDENVFVVGEDVAGYGGVFRMYDGLLDEFGARRMIDTPDLGDGDRRARRRRRRPRPAPGRRHHVHGLPRRLPGPGGQPGGEDEVHVRRRGPRADGASPWPPAPGCRAGAQHSQSLEAWLRAHARAEGRDAVVGLRRQGPDGHRRPRRQPGRS